MVELPYTQTQSQNVITRVFAANTSKLDLVWHRDRVCRQVTVLSGTGWQFQFDNQLPFVIEPSISWHVPAGIYHRLIKGQDDLTIEIVELESNDLECSPESSQNDHAVDQHRIRLCDKCAA